MLTKHSIPIFAAAALALFPALASAQPNGEERPVTPIQFGLSVGFGNSSADGEFQFDENMAQDFDESDSSLSFGAMLMFGRHFGIRARQYDFGDFADGQQFESAELDGLEFSVLGSYPLNDNFDVGGSLGVLSWDYEQVLTTRGNGFGGNDVNGGSTDGSSAIISVFGAYRFTKRFRASIEYVRTSVDGRVDNNNVNSSDFDADISIIAVTAQLWFGAGS